VAAPAEPEDDESDEEVVPTQLTLRTGGVSLSVQVPSAPLADPGEPEEESGEGGAPKEVTVRTGGVSLSVPVPSAPPDEPEDEEEAPKQSTVPVATPAKEEAGPQWGSLSGEGKLPAYQILLGLSRVAGRISGVSPPAAAVPKAADFDAEIYRWDPQGFTAPGPPGSGDTESKRRSRLKRRRAPLVSAAGKLVFSPLEFGGQARPPAGRVVVALTDRFDIPQPMDATPWRGINWRTPATLRSIENVELLAKLADREKGPIRLAGEAVVTSAAVTSEVDAFYSQKFFIAVRPSPIPQLGLMTHPKIDRPKKQKRDIAVIGAPTKW
jgi:hypothetical protein